MEWIGEVSFFLYFNVRNVKICLMIIDSHTHLTRKKNESFEDAKSTYLKDLKANGVDEAIVIADNVDDSDTADTDTLLEVFKNNSKSLYIFQLSI